MKIVFLPTAQFSGTRFLHYTVVPASGHPQWSRAKIQLTYKNGKYRAADTLDSGEVTHSFSESVEHLVDMIKCRLTKFVKEPDNFVAALVAHFGENLEFIRFEEQEKLMDLFPTACTLRDPLAILLTTESRRLGDVHHLSFDSYVKLARSDKSIFHVPADLYRTKSFEDRHTLISNLFSFLGIVPSDAGYIDGVASEWRMRGSVLNDASVLPENRKYAAVLRQAYIEGDLTKINEVVPRGYAALKEREPIVRPMLERAGYKNLIWWGE